MAFGYYMNMEKLSLRIAKKHVLCMTNNNYLDDCFLDDEKLINNRENGFVVITQLSCFFESFLNTIINACMNYTGESLLKCSVDEKIDIIFMHYKKELSSVKGQNPWSIYKSTNKVRNEMIHFKKTFIGYGTGVPNFDLGGQKVAEFFTKDNMEKIYKGYIELAELIADTLGLSIFKCIDIFEADGRDGLVNYVCDEKEIIIDQDRLAEDDVCL